MSRPEETSAGPRDGLGRPFWLLWAAAQASSLGDGLVLVAFPLLAASLTHDPRLIAGVAVAQRLPWLVCSLPAGALADRLDRRRLVAVVESARMVILVILGAIVALGATALVVVYVAAFLLGAFETVFLGAAQAALPGLVRRDQLTRANGYLHSAQSGGEQFAGPALGGIVFLAAAAMPFVLDGFSFAASAALLCLALPRRVTPTVSLADGRAGTTIRADVIEGLRWFAQNRLLRLVSGLIACLAFCQTMVLAILVLFSLQVLHLGTVGYGFFLAAGAAGNVAGGVFASRIHRRLGTPVILIGAAVAAGCSYLVISRTSSVVLVVLCFVVEAVSVAVGNVVTLTLRQSTIPPELLGRVSNAFRVCLYGAMPLGAMAGGFLARSHGLRTPFVVAGSLQIAVAAVLARPIARLLREAPADVDEPVVIDLVEGRAEELILTP